MTFLQITFVVFGGVSMGFGIFFFFTKNNGPGKNRLKLPFGIEVQTDAGGIVFFALGVGLLIAITKLPPSSDKSVIHPPMVKQQSNAIINGIVIDDSTKEGIDSATIWFLGKPHLTESNGNFYIQTDFKDTANVVVEITKNLYFENKILIKVPSVSNVISLKRKK